MGHSTSTPSTLARDLDFNPATCDRPACSNPAVLVLEAVVPDTTSDTGRKHWAVCEDITCLNWAQCDADDYAPIDTDLRDATAAELEALSGLTVLGAVA